MKKEMRKLSELKAYQGTDASNEISLYEYGLLCKVNKTSIHFYYGVGCDDSGNYSLFDYARITKKEIDSMINENWFHKYEFFSSLGMEEEIWLVCVTYIHKLFDLLSYYGFEYILGTTYQEPFEILNE